MALLYHRLKTSQRHTLYLVHIDGIETPKKVDMQKVSIRLRRRPPGTDTPSVLLSALWGLIYVWAKERICTAREANIDRSHVVTHQEAIPAD